MTLHITLHLLGLSALVTTFHTPFDSFALPGKERREHVPGLVRHQKSARMQLRSRRVRGTGDFDDPVLQETDKDLTDTEPVEEELPQIRDLLIPCGEPSVSLETRYELHCSTKGQLLRDRSVPPPQRIERECWVRGSS